ncbi:DUF2303 family protein [Acinetobacter sp. ANC 5045]|uniref:DUF2303 family protein n=1 Tax=Acinetobacter sp. ANC 5045 TaxID=2529851 RepID=UPI001038C9D2|nr:DUF2303 family protein [Acinetobacter sp. ANC 5045]TCB16104.1 DUF2303 family protein [Acinetobacter sp. ANC 5045]
MSDYKQAHEIGQTSLQQADNLPFVVIPEGGNVHTFENVLKRPLQLNQSVNLHTAGDFVAYVNRFADSNSMIFVNVLAGKIKAILDYHEARQDDAATSDQAKNQARHCKHVANFNVEQTPEFIKIREASGRTFTQSQFALFLEDVLPYISEPVAAELYEIVQTLSAKTGVDFKSGIRTDNGQVSLTYNETIEARAGVAGNLTIPERIVFGVKVHRGGEHYAIPARFRYRIKEGCLTLWYDIDQLEKAIEKSMEDTVDYIKNGKANTFADGEPVEISPGVHSFVTVLEGSAT